MKKTPAAGVMRAAIAGDSANIGANPCGHGG